jgi:hypothetical protein
MKDGRWFKLKDLVPKALLLEWMLESRVAQATLKQRG